MAREVFLTQWFKYNGKRYKPNTIQTFPDDVVESIIKRGAGKDPKEVRASETTGGVIPLARYEALEKENERLKAELEKENERLKAELEKVQKPISLDFIGNLKVKTLQAVAGDLELEGYSDLKKEELVPVVTEAIMKEIVKKEG